MSQASVALDPMTQGWFNHGARILALVEQYRPKVGVELGTWLGASAIPVVRMMQRWGGTLTCVDVWGGSVDGQGTDPSPWMLLACARNMIQAGVSASVRLIPSTSREAAKTWTEPLDYLYVDADHSYDAVRADLDAWVPKVKPGGLILGDDYGHRMFPGVRTAWDAFAQQHGFTLELSPPTPIGIQLVHVLR